MKKKFLYFFLIFFFYTPLFSKQNLINLNSEIIPNYNKIKKTQKKESLQFDFNRAVLMMEKKEYKKAIDIFEQTSTLIKIPSFLNMGIAYYHMKNYDKAKLYLNEIFNSKKIILENTFSYMAACFYLYKITKDIKYLDLIVNIPKKNKNLTEHSKEILADTFIILKDYKKALYVLDKINFSLDLKKAILYLKLKDYIKAQKYLQKAKNKAVTSDEINKILWIMVYNNLKANNLERLMDNLKIIKKRKNIFRANLELPLKIFFNKDKYTSKDYLSFITDFSIQRKIDYMFYFAPFIFSDTQEIIYDKIKGFIFKNRQNIQSLNKMVKYNTQLLNTLTKDPILRVYELQKSISTKPKSYIYYNLGLSYAQIFDFDNAYKYFQRAYKLNPGNKLYSVMTLIAAKRVNKKVPDELYIKSNIQSKKGLYNYFGSVLYHMFLDETFNVLEKPLDYEKSFFYKALVYLNLREKGKNNTLSNNFLKANIKDPLIYLMHLANKNTTENNLQYLSRLQNNLPLFLNDNFLKGPSILTSYYLDLLNATGMFSKATLSIQDQNRPFYLRVKALIELYKGDSKVTLEILNKLQKKYKLEDRYTMYLLVAALLDQNKYQEASVQLSLMRLLLGDDNANFLTGIQLIQQLKLSSIKQYFKSKYLDNKIDFKLINLDKLLQTL